MVKPATPKNIVFYADDDTDDLELVQEAFGRYTNDVEVVTARVARKHYLTYNRWMNIVLHPVSLYST